MILSGDVNIYTQEIENVLVVHPSVADVAIIGIPDRRTRIEWGNRTPFWFRVARAWLQMLQKGSIIALGNGAGPTRAAALEGSAPVLLTSNDVSLLLFERAVMGGISVLDTPSLILHRGLREADRSQQFCAPKPLLWRLTRRPRQGLRLSCERAK